MHASFEAATRRAAAVSDAARYLLRFRTRTA